MERIDWPRLAARWCAPLDAGGLGQPYSTFGEVTPGIVSALMEATAQMQRGAGQRGSTPGKVSALVSMPGQPGGSRASGQRPAVVIEGPWTGGS